MEFLIIILNCLISILILGYIYGFNFKNIKKIKELGFSKELNEITNKLPENTVVCEEVLKQIDNFGKVKVVQDKNENAKASFYIAVTNTISIANINKTCTRIQTIAHECIHSIQDRKILMFNFIFSNIYIIYFFIISVLALFNKLNNPFIHLFILTLFGFIYYKVRGFLETDAMTRAPFIANTYIKNTNILTDDEVNKIMDCYKQINDIGIKIANLNLYVKCIIKIIIFCIICII